MFSNQKSQIWVNFGGPWNEKKLAYSTYGHLDYITAICDILWPFGNLV
jgi:hypothetical protein